MNRRGLNLRPLTDADFDILTEPGPEELIINCSLPPLHSSSKLIDNLVTDFLPFCLLSRLMLETSLKGMHRLDRKEKLTAQRVSREKLEASMMHLDIDLMSQFGKFNTHCHSAHKLTYSQTLQGYSAVLVSSPMPLSPPFPFSLSSAL